MARVGGERSPLKLVDPETGELTEHACPNCARLQEEADGANAEKRSWRSKYYAAKRNKDKEAREHELWGLAVALFWEWKIATNHLMAHWTADRFWTCHPNLSHDGFEMCRFAVWGMAANVFEKAVTPSYTKRYDEFWRVFGTKEKPVRDTFEENVNAGVAIFGKELPIPPALESDDG